MSKEHECTGDIMQCIQDEWVAYLDSAASTSATIEATPDGLGQHEPGAKLDAGKNRLGLVLGDFANALWSVGEVGTFGANKYTDSGWMSVENAQSRYMDALFRHILKYKMGEKVDSDSGLPHLAHAAWNILALIELGERNE